MCKSVELCERGARGILVTVVERGSALSSMADNISRRANTLRKDMNPTVLPNLWVNKKAGFFKLGMATGQREEKLWIQNCNTSHRIDLIPANWSCGESVRQWSGRHRFNLRSCVLPKTLKMVLDISLLNTQQYKVRIKGKVEQSRESSSAIPYT